MRIRHPCAICDNVCVVKRIYARIRWQIRCWDQSVAHVRHFGAFTIDSYMQSRLSDACMTLLTTSMDACDIFHYVLQLNVEDNTPIVVSCASIPKTDVFSSTQITVRIPAHGAKALHRLQRYFAHMDLINDKYTLQVNVQLKNDTWGFVSSPSLVDGDGDPLAQRLMQQLNAVDIAESRVDIAEDSYVVCSIAARVDSSRKTSTLQDRDLQGSKKLVIYRYANDVPLLDTSHVCAITNALAKVRWSRFGIMPLAYSENKWPLATLSELLAEVTVIVHVHANSVMYGDMKKTHLQIVPAYTRAVKLAAEEALRQMAWKQRDLFVEEDEWTVTTYATFR
eukprot:TRINITY_DN1428_c0_g1_i1.p1 TRINITY_DN1428_c0_g1~~TRINITY_DN1428_c0_g1_i1.p1  ORF type:complete len:337 (-),score=56.45 TRINITY_DN1428_c0_g1_i1:414-1424(-)